jgi:predicted membrane protein
MIFLSTLLQILGSLCVFLGYWLNSKNHARQHMLFIFGHIFLIAFSIIETKWVLVALSVFVIYMQFKISKKKYKFKKDIVRVKKVARKVKHT